MNASDPKRCSCADPVTRVLTPENACVICSSKIATTPPPPILGPGLTLNPNWILSDA
jgi:hypothetical protein